MPKITGHTETRDYLKKLREQSLLPSTILLSGAEGIGKKLVAEELAISLLCENHVQSGCQECSNCKLFAAKNLPDYHLVEAKEKDIWKVDAIRNLLYQISLKSFSGKPRVIVFNDAELLNLVSANVLLKSLEEPRENTYFILITSNPSRLPQTLLSRCQIFYFSNLSKNQLSEIANESLKINITEELVEHADGSVRNLLTLSESMDDWKLISDLLDNVIEGQTQYIQDLLSTLNTDKDTLREKVFLLQSLVRVKMRKATESYEAKKWSVFLENLCLFEYYILDRNLNLNYLLTQLLINLASSDSDSLTEVII